MRWLSHRRRHGPDTRVTEQPPGNSGQRRWPLLEALSKHPLVTAAVVVATFLAAVAGFISDSGLGSLISRGFDTGRVSDAAPTTSSSPLPPPLSATPASIAVGSCLDDGGVPTACDTAHAAEVFDLSGNCSHSSLLDYLGGSPGQDVLRADVSIRSWQTDDLLACIVDEPVDARASSSQDSLLGRSGDVWRRCRDQLSREVTCADPHKAEVIYEQQAAGQSLDCKARADTYLQTPFDGHSEDLQLLQDGAYCYVEARGDSVLTHSLRRLGSSALPLGIVTQD